MVVEEKDTIFCAEEWPCNPNIQFAEYLVEELGQAAPKACQTIEIFLPAGSEQER